MPVNMFSVYWGRIPNGNGRCGACLPPIARSLKGIQPTLLCIQFLLKPFGNITINSAIKKAAFVAARVTTLDFKKRELRGGMIILARPESSEAAKNLQFSKSIPSTC